MPKALEVIGFRATAIGATLAALTNNTGNSNIVRAAAPNTVAWLIQMWCDVQVAGTIRVRSPKLHDNVQGIRFDTVVSDVIPLMPWGVRQILYPQDTLTVELAGSAVAGDVEDACLLIYYDDLPGVQARLAKWSDIAGKIQQIVTVENTIATTTTGDWGGEEAINAEFDLLKANTDYALLGYTVDTEGGAVGWRGADTGNLRVGGPACETNRDLTTDWFKSLAIMLDLPLIPVFNSANKAGILIDAMQDENDANITVNSIFAELGSGVAGRG